MEIAGLRCAYQNLEKKNKELISKLDELSKKNNFLSKENISLKYSHKDISKQTINNNNNSDKNKIIEELNRKILKISNEKNDAEKTKKNLKNSNNELIKEKNDLEKKLSQALKDIEMINRNMKEMSEIKDNYRDKYQRINEELLNEKQKVKILEKKIQEIYDNNYNNIFLDESKTRTYKNAKINKINEIEIEKIAKSSHQSPQCTHKSISRFSTNNTSNTKKIYNNIEDIDLSPENYNIIKQIQINNLKWYLFKKIKKNYLIEPESTSKGIQPLYRRYQYLKFCSKSKKNKEKIPEDSYSDFIWKSYKDEKDFVNFNLENINQIEKINDNEKDKKIDELQICIKDLREKLIKKENDCNRINLNYAKLFKKTKRPEMTYDKLLEENDKLKNENRLLNKKIEKLIENQKFIGISFIEDDLEGSNFIDDNVFEKLLEEITKNREDKNEQEIITMKCFKSNEDNKNKDKMMLNFGNRFNTNGTKETIENKYKIINKDLKLNLNNKLNNNIKEENMKETMTDRNNKGINEIKIEKEINKNQINTIENKRTEKQKSNNFMRYHKSIRNTRNINSEIDILKDKNSSTKEVIYQKINPQSLNLELNSINKTKNSKIENLKERRTGFIIRRRKYIKEKQENDKKNEEIK